MARRWWVVLALAGVAAQGWSCSDVLGIEDAEPDPLFGTGGGTASPLCQEYCDTVQTHCTEELEVYTSVTACLDVCAALPAGEDGATSGNSVHCRLGNARTAENEPDTECPAAGPGGDGICGDNCGAFCVLFETACATKFGAAYAGQDACLDDCAATIPDTGGYTTAQSKGDSLQCRLWHASVALDDPIQHCIHVAGEHICVAAGGAGGSGGAGGAGGG
ncbi:MAG: hypothetical protein JRI68_31785 [Deltaproteobacteria bacterium]|nr:hypothetical protein [Deltaproteobacteria bacterium]